MEQPSLIVRYLKAGDGGRIVWDVYVFAVKQASGCSVKESLERNRQHVITNGFKIKDKHIPPHVILDTEIR